MLFRMTWDVAWLSTFAIASFLFIGTYKEKCWMLSCFCKVLRKLHEDLLEEAAAKEKLHVEACERAYKKAKRAEEFTKIIIELSRVRKDEELYARLRNTKQARREAWDRLSKHFEEEE